MWAFMGDGEMDEPESMGSISLAAREHLDNLVFVVNCNLQRLDGPVRGNGKIIQELETNFRGAGWNVIKVIWGSRWDPLLAADTDGALVRRMDAALDGDYQTYKSRNGAYVREHFFGASPALRELVADLSDEQVWALNRGGHDARKVFAAYRAAAEHRGQPTVILAKTIKGYGLGEAGEGQNITHQQKKMTERRCWPSATASSCRSPTSRRARATCICRRPTSPRAHIPARAPRGAGRRAARPPPPRGAPACCRRCRASRRSWTARASARSRRRWRSCGSCRRSCATRRSASGSCRSCPMSRARSGWRGCSASWGSFSQVGQLYEPEDSEQLMFYREDKRRADPAGGDQRAGPFSSWIAAATSYSNHDFPTIPFYIFYSMFGFQRIGDLAWAAGDSRARGFLIGGTAGRTTLNGEGLQHEDGHSHLLASAIPNCRAYDPALGTRWR